jgi:hypothetical protein
VLTPQLQSFQTHFCKQPAELKAQMGPQKQDGAFNTNEANVSSCIPWEPNPSSKDTTSNGIQCYQTLRRLHGQSSLGQT